MKFNINHVVIAACGAIIIVELYEWLYDTVYNFSAGTVLGMAVLCIMLVMRNKGE